MKTLQRLEILSGVFYFFSVLAYLYFIDMPLSKRIAERHEDPNWHYWDTPAVLIGIVIHLIIPVCAYFHAFRRSYVALGGIILVGGTTTFMILYGAMLGNAFEGHVGIGLSPVVLANLTMIFAFINTIIVYQKRLDDHREASR